MVPLDFSSVVSLRILFVIMDSTDDELLQEVDSH